MDNYQEETHSNESVGDFDQESSSGDTSSAVNLLDPRVDILQMPSLGHDVVAAKKYLHSVSDHDGISLYVHLSELLAKFLTERPPNAVEFFEEYSREVKGARFLPDEDLLRDVHMPPDAYDRAASIVPMFEIVPAGDERDGDQVDDVVSNVANLMESAYYFEQVGVGLPRQEMFLVSLSLRKLSQDQPIEHLRFWGKILGTSKNYFVAEAQLTEDEYAKRNAAIDEEEVSLEEEKAQHDELTDMKETAAVLNQYDVKENMEGEEREKLHEILSKLPPIPQSLFKVPVDVPRERPGSGANKMVYYVCNHPGESWTMLPDVTPQQIFIARKVKKLFTGELSSKILTSPAFPGTEMNYLRAQIARISAGTQVSPRGFYSTGQDEEEEEVLDEEGIPQDIVENPEYEPLSLKELLDVDNWVHHTSHILEQGRVVWWSPSKEGEVQEEEEDKEEEELSEMPIKETGPPLLNPLSEDFTQETVTPWSTRSSSRFAPETAVIVVMSNLWPGAFCFTMGRKTENVYIGLGHKYTSTNFTPDPMEQIQSTYQEGPEIMEMADPTPEEEEAWHMEHAPKEDVMEEEQEEEEEESIEDDE